MKKVKIRIFTTLIAVILFTISFSTTAFAGGGEEYTEPTIETIETPNPNPVPLTPDGNLTLVDDISEEQSEEKQYMTVVTKNGNYFYIIVDRAGDKENVYFLNMVDEADLLALIEDMDTVQQKPVVTPQPEPEPEVTPEPEQQEEKSGGTSGILLLLLLVGGGVGGAFYYFKVLKNKSNTKGSTDLGEYEFDYDDEVDEEEYEIKDEEDESEDEI
jgi:hypothetical protein